MLTDNRADERTQDWFLIACEGDLVLKLAQDLMIGEDERGQTVLSPAREDALLRITSENGSLTLQATAMDWTFSEEGGLSVQHLTFVEGLTLKLSFPSSTLILTPDFQAGTRARADREIRLTPTETPTLTLTRVDEPVTLIEPALLAAPVSEPEETEPQILGDVAEPHDLAIEEATEQALAAEMLASWDHQIPDEQVEEEPPELPAETGAEAVPAEIEAAAEVEQAPEPEPDETITAEVVTLPPPVARKSHRPLGGLIAAAALLAPMAVYLVEGHKLGVDFPLTNYLPFTDNASAETEATGSISRGAVERTDTKRELAGDGHSVAEPVAVDPATTLPATPVQPQPTIASARTAPTVDQSQQLLIASLLAEAKAFYNAGLIVTPIEANTVSHLTQVLSIDPNNEEGLRLMYLSAVTLIEEAEAAHAAGDNYLARNLVEDVLGFHPEFDDARVLLDSWTRVPEG